MRPTGFAAVFGLLFATTFAVGGKESRYYGGGGSFAPMPMVAEGPGDPAIEKMIKDLGADDWRTREQAGRDLAAKGEKALPYMRRVLLATEDPEVQRRLSVLVRKLDHDRLVSPKTITFSAKDMTAKQIVAEITKQSGYKIDFQIASDTKHSFEFNKTPFWKALDMVASASSCTAYMDYEDDTIRMQNQDATNPYVSYAGPFHFIATSLNSSRTVALSGISKRGNNPRGVENLNLSFQVQSEPKNPMLSIAQPELLEATDNLGSSLLMPKNSNEYRSYYGGYYNRGNRTFNTYMNAQLMRTDQSATTIKTLKGRVRIELLSGTVPDIVVADPLKVKQKSYEGRTLHLEVNAVEEVANNKGMYQVSVNAKRRDPVDPNRGEDYVWAQNLHQRLELCDEKGNRYFSYGINSSNHNNGALQMTMMFGTEDRRSGNPSAVKLGPPARLTLNEWITVMHEVTFEFKDIPLP